MADDDLELAGKAFERGDYAEVRRRARAVLAASPGDEEARRARALLARTGPDRAALILGVLALVFIVIVAAVYLGQSAR